MAGKMAGRPASFAKARPGRLQDFKEQARERHTHITY